MNDTNTQYHISRPRSLYGQGLSFPPRVGPNGCLAWSAGEDNVRESIRILLLTEPGERLMREEVGCGLRRFLFEPNTATTRQLIRERINNTLQRWEPRVNVEAVMVDADADDARIVHINIVVRLIATQVVERLAMSLQLEG
jgi:phage baseplate assembly protein W